MTNTETSGETHPAVDGRAWAEYCDALKSAGDLILEHSTDDLDRIEGFRYLSRLSRGALQAFVENGDAPFSRILPIPYNLKIGCDNPDADYRNVPIDPTYDYRVHGPRNTVNYLSIGAYSGGYASGSATPGRQGVYEHNNPGPDDLVDLVLSVERPDNLGPGQTWLEMSAETTTLIIRNFFLDRTTETASDLTITCLNPPSPHPESLTPERLHRGLAMAGLYVHGVSQMFIGWIEDLFQQRPNTLDFVPREDAADGWGDPNQLFRHGYWTLEPGHAIVVRVPAIEAYYWNFQLNNLWEESLDYEHRQVTVNAHTATYEADGTALLIVADDDPGFGNWIDTADHRHGGWGLRYNQVVTDIAPTVDVVSLDDLHRFRSQ